MRIMGSVREQQARCTCARGAVSAGSGDGISVHVEKCTSVQGAVSMHRKRDLRCFKSRFNLHGWRTCARGTISDGTRHFLFARKGESAGEPGVVLQGNF